MFGHREGLANLKLRSALGQSNSLLLEFNPLLFTGFFELDESSGELLELFFD